MDYQEKARRVIALEIAELQRMHDRIDGGFSDAVDVLREVQEEGSKIVVLGVGKSGSIGRKLTATLNSTGATSTWLNCLDALHGDLGVVDDGDAVVALSYSGETDELLAVLPHLMRFRIRLVAVTGKPDSTLARQAEAILDVNVEREACPLNLAPTSSTTNMLVACDALAMVLLEARGFRKEDFAELHPGGSLGRALLTRARDIMRSTDHLARVPLEATVREALEAMGEARSGAAVIVDAAGRLAGIFTQGDFARAFQREDDLGSRDVRDFMTAEPVTIAADKLAAEVLALLENHPIDDLVVLDGEGRPIGLIDTQDFARLKLV